MVLDDPEAGGKMELLSPESAKGVDLAGPEPESPDSLLATSMSQLSISSDLAKRLLRNGFVSDSLDSIDMTEAIVWTVERKQMELLQELISQGADVNLPAEDGWTCLNLAADTANHEILQVLLKNGADVDGISGKYGLTALHWAADVGDSQGVEILISHGSNVDAQSTIGSYPLHLAANNGCVKTIRALLEADASIQCFDHKGFSPLHEACRRGHDDAVQLLIERGADVSIKCKQGQAPIHAAALTGQYKIIKKLLEYGADGNATTENGRSVLAYTVSANSVPSAQTLLDHGADIETRDNNDNTPLLVAVLCNAIEMASFLLEHDANVEAADDNGVSIDARTTHDENTALIRAVRDGYPQIVSLLIKLGADVNASNNIGWTPLHFAAETGFEDVVEILLKAGANATAESHDGKRPRTISWENNHHSVTTILDGSVPISLDAQLHSKALRLSALFYAARNGHLNKICQVLDEGIDVNSLDADGRSSLSMAAEHGWNDIVQCLTGRNADANLKDNYGGSPLWWASRYGHANIVDHLLNQGAHVDSPDADEQSPLSASSQYGHVETIKLLLEHGANPNSSTGYGKSPLLFAVENEHLDAVKLLLESGADINYKSPEGDSALSLAEEHGLGNIVEVLKAHPSLIMIKTKADDGDRSEGAVSPPMSSTERSSDPSLKRHWMLIYASRKGQIAMIKRLIQAGVDPNSSATGRIPLYEAASLGKSEAVAILVEHGAVVDPEESSRSPLVTAAFYGYTSTVKLLHSLGASLETGYQRGRTALTEAAEGGHEETTSLLLQLGVKTEVKDGIGRGPLWTATMNRHMNIVKLLVDYGANIEAADHFGLTPLMVAVRNGDRKLTEFFLKKGSQMRPESEQNYSPLCYAAANGDEGIVNLLLDHGADVNYFSDGKRTALHIATIRGNLMVMKMLIEAGANVDLRDGDGRTALSLAKEGSNDASMRLLCRASSLRRDSHRQQRKADEVDFDKKGSYHYQPLMMKNSTRIIELYPGVPGDILEFELEEVPLFSATPFEALSYEWQERYGTIPVQCDGQKIFITPNCKAAMEKLRLRDKSRYLWIDAICINQTNEQERNQQVAIMGNIYRAAQRVVMWLGEETETIRAAFEMLPTVAKAQCMLLQAVGEFPGGEMTTEGVEDPKKMLESMFKEQSAMDAFWDLMQRTYWTRAWILPEIVIAGSRGIVMCGNQSCEWTTLQLGMPIYEYCNFGQPPMIFNSGLVGDMGPEAEMLFEDVVFVLHTLQATDPRDKIFASLGLVSQGRRTIGKKLVEAPIADYTMSVQQVFIHAARYLIDLGGAFWAWRLGIQRSTKKVDNLPSWVPDFNRRLAFAEINPFREIKTSYRLDIKEDPVTTETTLWIGGCIVDKVVFKLTLTKDLEISAILSLAADVLAKTNRSIYGKYPIGEGFDVNSNIEDLEKQKDTESLLMKSTNAMALFTTITNSSDTSNEDDNGTIPEKVLPLLTGYLIYTLSKNMDTPELSKTAPNYVERFAETWAKGCDDAEAFIDFELDNLELVEDVLREDRDLVYTENGYFGLTNTGEAEVGMVVAMVGGDTTLRLLRKKEDTTPFYEYADMVFLNTMGQEVENLERMYGKLSPERLEIR
ncbi:Ankyrin-3 [Fusarium culmorum]|uniref:Ankyrin-3 n=1 Tax=Fusarium culmorum TaxID=5516 RepID=A0A2T4GWB2_FUSCU|nr:Ankyrin-3 [Fusarium culmorum]